MFSVKDVVSYGSQGVCEIVETTVREIKKEKIEYFVLAPVFDKNSKIFVPIHNEKLIGKMKQLLTAQQAQDIIKGFSEVESIWIDNDNLRREKYREIVVNADRNELISLIKTLYVHRNKQKEFGKKLHITDDRYLHDAERIIFDELAFVLKLEQQKIREDVEQMVIA